MNTAEIKDGVPEEICDGAAVIIIIIKLRWAFICHIHNYTEYNQQWNVFSAFNPSKYTHTWFVCICDGAAVKNKDISSPNWTFWSTDRDSWPDSTSTEAYCFGFTFHCWNNL